MHAMQLCILQQSVVISKTVLFFPFLCDFHLQCNKHLQFSCLFGLFGASCFL